MQIRRGKAEGGHVHWHQADTQGVVLGCNTSYFIVPTCPCCHEQWTVLIAVLWMLRHQDLDDTLQESASKSFWLPNSTCLPSVYQTPCVYPLSTWHHHLWPDLSGLPLHVCILQMIKDWRWEWRGDEANNHGFAPTTCGAFLLHICTLQVIRDWNGRERRYTSC